MPDTKWKRWETMSETRYIRKDRSEELDYWLLSVTYDREHGVWDVQLIHFDKQNYVDLRYYGSAKAATPTQAKAAATRFAQSLRTLAEELPK